MCKFLEFRVVFVILAILFSYACKDIRKQIFVIFVILVKKVKYKPSVEVRLKITKFVILVLFAFLRINHPFLKYGNIV